MAEKGEKAMKKVLISIIIFSVIILGGFCNYSNAATTLDGTINQGDSFISTGKSQNDIATINGTKFSNVVKKVYNILLTIGVAVSVIIIGVMGIRIITGSVEDKAEIKEQMVPYLIGCGVMFGAFAIWKIAMVIAGAVG